MKKILFSSFVFIVLLCHTIKAADYESDYGSSHTYNKIILPGNKTFQVNKIPVGYWCEFYVNNEYKTSKQSKLLDRNLKYSWNCVTSVTIKARIWASGIGYIEDHIWNITIAKPDLIVQNPNVSPTFVTSGEKISVSCIIKNQGDVKANFPLLQGKELYYYLSTNTTYGSSDIELGTTNLSNFDAGEARVIDGGKKTIPSDTESGTYYVLFYVDKEDDIDEGDNEDNNINYKQITVHKPMPDLIVQNPEVSPTNINSGEKISVSCTIKNQGDAKANFPLLQGKELYYYLSTDTTYGSSDIELGTTNLSDFDASEARVIDGGKKTIPSDTESGTYYVLFYVDKEDDIDEGDYEVNNIGYKQIVVHKPPMRDLIVVNSSISPDNLVPGESFSVSCDVKNDGDDDAQQSKLKYYLSADNNYELNDEYLGVDYVRNIGGLGAGKTCSKTANLKIPENTAPGSYYILFYADAENKVIEGNNENNNIAYVPVTINPPSGTINLILNNVVDGTPYPGSNGIVKLYNYKDELIETRSTSNGTAIFNNVPIGRNYWCYMFHDSKSTIWGQEFWGKLSEININNDNDIFNTSFTRDMPYIESVDFYNGSVSVNGQTVTLNTPLTIKVIIRNNGSPYYVKPVLILDKEKDSYYDYKSIGNNELVEGNGGSITYQFPYNPLTTGQYYFTSAVKTNYSELDGGYITTDSWAWSSEPILTVEENTMAPIIILHPERKNVLANQFVKFSITAEGTNLKYQWKKDGIEIDNATSSTYTINTVSIADEGNYTCVVINNYDSIESEVATLTVNDGDCIYIGNLQACANNKTVSGNNEYVLSGNVSLNNIIYFDGNITVDQNESTIEGDCRIYLDNIYSRPVDLYNGPFKFSVQSETLIKKSIYVASDLFDLAGLPVYIGKIIVLNDGVRIEGEIEFPEVMDHFKAEIDTLEITKSAGINLVGEISIKNIKLHNTVGLQDLTFNFNTEENSFTGTCKVGGQIFGSIEAGTKIINGKLDSIGMDYEPAPPKILLGTTGFRISSIHYNVDGISNPPLILTAGVDIAPVFPFSENIVRLNNVDLSYTWGTVFTGSGTLQIFKIDMADAYIKISKDNIEFGGEVNLYDLITGEFTLGLYKIIYPEEKIELHGHGKASLILPDKYGFPFGFIRCFVDLPYTIAEVDNYLKNTTIGGNFSVGNYKAHYLLEWTEYKFRTDYGRGYKNWNEILNKKSYVLMNDEKLSEQNRFEGKSLILSKSKSKGGKHTLSYDIIGISSTMVIRVFDTTKIDLPYYTLTLPDGNIVAPYNVSHYSNITYNENVNEFKSFYSIENPDPGQYELTIDCTSDTILVDIFGAIVPPVIMLDSLKRINDSTTIISWVDSDPDSDAEISLYYDNDNKNANGVLLQSGISENDLKNHYTWNHFNLPSGIYYVYAIISDTVTSSTPVYSPDFIKIVNLNAPKAPENLTYTLTDTSIILNWINENTIPVNHIVYYAFENDKLNYNSLSYNVGSDTTFEFINFVPGKTYRFFVTAIDSLYRESDYSNIITFEYSSTSLNQAPSIISDNLPGLTYIDSVYSYQLICNDPDGDTLYYSLINAPTGMHISNSGLITWEPVISAVGIHFVKIKVTDPGNLSDYLSFYITVFDLSNNVEVAFNKSIYECYSDLGFVYLYDADLFKSSYIIDTVSMHLYSKADSIGIDLKAIETEPNTKIFIVYFEFSETSNINNKLHVYDQDTIYLQYIDKTLHDTLIDISYFDNQPLHINIDGPESACIGETITLTVDEGYESYFWSDSISTTDNIFFTNQPGKYSVIVSNSSGCFGYDTITITTKTLSIAPSEVSANRDTVCPGDSTTLTINGGSLGTGASWEWYSDSCGGTHVGLGSSISVSPNSTSTYYVRAEGDCNTTSCANVTLNVNSLSTAPSEVSANPDTVCPGDSTTLTINGGSLGTGASWEWYSDSCGGKPVGSGSSISVSPNSTSTYYVRAKGDCDTTS